MNTIEQATTEELSKELMSRFEAACFVGHRPGCNGYDSETCSSFTGPPPFCEGLLLGLLRKMSTANDLSDSTEDDDVCDI